MSRDKVNKISRFFSKTEETIRFLESVILNPVAAGFIILSISVLSGMVDGYHDPLYVKAFAIAGSFTIICLEALLRISRSVLRYRYEKLTDNGMMRILREEGFVPLKGDDGSILLKIQGTVFTFGKNSNGFVFARIAYDLMPERRVQAMQIARQTELSFVAVKVLIIPENDTELFSVESLCNDTETYRTFIHRSLSILSDSVRFFNKKMCDLEIDGGNQPKAGREDHARDITDLIPKKARPS